MEKYKSKQEPQFSNTLTELANYLKQTGGGNSNNHSMQSMERNSSMNHFPGFDSIAVNQSGIHSDTTNIINVTHSSLKKNPMSEISSQLPKVIDRKTTN